MSPHDNAYETNTNAMNRIQAWAFAILAAGLWTTAPSPAGAVDINHECEWKGGVASSPTSWTETDNWQAFHNLLTPIVFDSNWIA